MIILAIAAIAAAAVTDTINIANSQKLQTWYHDKWEYNTNSPVADDAVRVSPFYSVRVEDAGESDHQQYDTFVYMSIPRGGRDKWGYSSDDGAEFASNANLTMSCANFIYHQIDCWVYIDFCNISNIVSLVDRV